MDGAVVGAALVSAFLHAAWNAGVRASADPEGAMASQVVASGLAALPFLLLFPLPGAAAWPWLAASAACNLLTMLALVAGYAHGGDFGVVYPLARAASPLLVALFARVLVGERLGPIGGAGVATISVGVALFAAGRGPHRPAALAFALAAGLCSAGYAVCDAQGGRLSPSVAGYGMTASALNAALFAAVHLLRGRGPLRVALRTHPGMATVGAAAAVLSYLLILWVWSQTRIAVGAALRDTSIVFAAVIAVVVLKEPPTRTRLAGVAVVAAGAALLRFA